MIFSFSSTPLRFSLLFGSGAIALLAACSSTPVTGSSGEGSGEGTSSSSGETSSNGGPTLGTPVGGGSSSGESSSNGSTSSGSSGTSSSSSSGSSGASSSGSSGTSTAPRPECVAWANRHCTCLENVGAAAADCRTKTAKGCDDAVRLCPKQLSWYTCSQTTCGNTCPNPGC